MGRRSKEIPQGDRLRDEAILVIENPATVPFRSLVPIGSNCDFVIVILSLFFWTAEQCGIGRFHWILLLACGMGLAADMAELLVLGFVLPSAEVDFCISKTQTRIIGESSIRFFFLGPTHRFADAIHGRPANKGQPTDPCASGCDFSKLQQKMPFQRFSKSIKR